MCNETEASGTASCATGSKLYVAAHFLLAPDPTPVPGRAGFRAALPCIESFQSVPAPFPLPKSRLTMKSLSLAQRHKH